MCPLLNRAHVYKEKKRETIGAHKRIINFLQFFILNVSVHTLWGADNRVATIHCVVAMVTIWRRIGLRFWWAIWEGAGTAKNISVSESQTPVLFFLIWLALEIKGFLFLIFTDTCFLIKGISSIYNTLQNSNCSQILAFIL